MFNVYLITFSTHGGFYPCKENISHSVIQFIQVGCIWVMISQILWCTHPTVQFAALS